MIFQKLWDWIRGRTRFEKSWRKIRHEYVACDNRKKIAGMMLAAKQSGLNFGKIQEGWYCNKWRTDQVTIQACLSEGGCAREIASMMARMQGRGQRDY